MGIIMILMLIAMMMMMMMLDRSFGNGCTEGSNLARHLNFVLNTCIVFIIVLISAVLAIIIIFTIIIIIMIKELITMIRIILHIVIQASFPSICHNYDSDDSNNEDDLFGL